MGDLEDTFTKQEIQAGYVTSGRDVLARQQQQMAAQQLNGSSGPTARRRIGGGGPSGSGRVSLNPIFPAPCYDEPAKPERSGAISASPSFGVSHNALSRSSSLPASSSASTTSSNCFLSAAATSNPPSSKGRGTVNHSTPQSNAAERLSHQQEHLRRNHQQSKQSKVKQNGSVTATTAARVVAGGPNIPSTTQPQTTHITALTPLNPKKLNRAASVPSTPKEKGTPSKQKFGGAPPATSPIPVVTLHNNNQYSIDHRREAAMPKQQFFKQCHPVSTSVGAVGTNPKMAPGYENKSGYIGGSVLVGGMGPVGGSQPNAFSPYSAGLPGLSMGNSLPSASNPGLIGITGNSTVGDLAAQKEEGWGMHGGNGIANFQEDTQRQLDQDPFGKSEKWRSTENLGSPSLGSGLLGTGSFGLPGGGIWGDGPMSSAAQPPNNSPSGAFLNFNERHNQPGACRTAVGEPSQNHYTAPISGGPILKKNPFTSSQSANLANILGINLPTGSGTLREREHPKPALPPHGAMNHFPSNFNQNPPPSTALWSQPNQKQYQYRSAPIGSNNNNRSAQPVGGLAIGNAPRSSQQNSDIELLHRLLPGVHITSGNAHKPATPTQQGWNDAANPQQQQRQEQPNSSNNNQGMGDTWGSGVSLFDNTRTNVPHHGMNNQSSIW